MKQKQNILKSKTTAFQTERFWALLQARLRVIIHNNYVPDFFMEIFRFHVTFSKNLNLILKIQIQIYSKRISSITEHSSCSFGMTYMEILLSDTWKFH